MSQLYDMRLRIEEKIKTDGLNAMDVRGKFALKTGKMLALISATTTDEPEMVAKMKAAAKEILNLNL